MRKNYLKIETSDFHIKAKSIAIDKIPDLKKMSPDEIYKLVLEQSVKLIEQDMQIDKFKQTLHMEQDILKRDEELQETNRGGAARV